MQEKRLLIVDDEPLVAEYIATVAESCGMATRVTTHANDFKHQFSEWAPTLIAVDLALPETDGVELLRFLADSGCKEEVLIISGFDSKILQAAQRLGVARGLKMAGIITKPIRAQELKSILTQIT